MGEGHQEKRRKRQSSPQFAWLGPPEQPSFKAGWWGLYVLAVGRQTWDCILLLLSSMHATVSSRPYVCMFYLFHVFFFTFHTIHNRG